MQLLPAVETAPMLWYQIQSRFNGRQQQKQKDKMRYKAGGGNQ